MDTTGWIVEYLLEHVDSDLSAAVLPRKCPGCEYAAVSSACLTTQFFASPQALMSSYGVWSD